MFDFTVKGEKIDDDSIFFDDKERTCSQRLWSYAKEEKLLVDETIPPLSVSFYSVMPKRSNLKEQNNSN